MKLLTKEEEDAHYRAVLKGGTFGGVVGLIGGAAGVVLASRRYHTIRNLTLPMKAFLVTSSGTFLGIIAADHASRSYEAARNQELQWLENREERLRQEELKGMSFVDRMTAWARRERYKIVGATWVASMIGSFAMVSRNKYLSGSQKIVQARVYAQGLTLAVLVASAAFEISDQRKGKGILKQKAEKAGADATVQEEVAPTASSNEREDLWKDMVAAEEDRLKKKRQSLYQHHEDNHKGHEDHEKQEKDLETQKAQAEQAKKQEKKQE